jgi:F-type H+-transporting ATPase subunit b
MPRCATSWAAPSTGRRLAFAVSLAGMVFAASSFFATNTAAQAAREPAPAQQPPPHPLPPARAGDPHAPPPRAADPHAPPSGVDRAGHGAAPSGRQPVRVVPKGSDPHNPHRNVAADPHAKGGHGEPSHGEHAEHDEKAPPPPINWWHGLLGEKADVPPSILWRQPGEPAPFLASVINFGILLLIVNRYGRKAMSDALVRRKESITREIDEATRLRRSAEERLAQYEAKLEKISEELERVRREFREQGERDKERIIQEAKERSLRMRKDTDLILMQEAKQMRQELLAEVVREATRIATEILAKNTTLGDHDRFAEAFLQQLRTSARLSVSPPARGGSSYPGPAAAKGNPS